MLAEITLIQQSRLFLGHPTYAITVVLGTLLVAGGVGSGIAGRLQSSSVTPIPLPWWPPVGVVAALALWLILWPQISVQFRSLELTGRVALVAVAALPAGIFIGMPFPVGLRAVGYWGERQVALGWAVNGVTSVAGSILAVAFAMWMGYQAVLLLAITFYALVAVVAITLPIRS